MDKVKKKQTVPETLKILTTQYTKCKGETLYSMRRKVAQY